MTGTAPPTHDDDGYRRSTPDVVEAGKAPPSFSMTVRIIETLTYDVILPIGLPESRAAMRALDMVEDGLVPAASREVFFRLPGRIPRRQAGLHVETPFLPDVVVTWTRSERIANRFHARTGSIVWSLFRRTKTPEGHGWFLRRSGSNPDETYLCAPQETESYAQAIAAAFVRGTLR